MNAERERAILSLLLEQKQVSVAEQEDYVRQCMLRHARASYLLCNSNKIGKQYYHNLCSAGELQGIFSTAEPPEALRGLFRRVDAE